MKVWVTGATGLLGREVMKALLSVPGMEVMGGCHARRAPGCEVVDLTDAAQTEAFLERFRPEMIIHAAAERRPDVSEKAPEMVQQLNVAATGTLARWCAHRGAALAYLSTDYVFDGSSPPYASDSNPHPINLYGRSKRAGEEAVIAAGFDRWWVLRVPILFGPTDRLGESAVTALAEKMLNARPGEPLEMDHWAIRYPTFTPDVAAVLRKGVLLERAGTGIRGIQHWSGEEPLTKYAMARAMAPMVGFDPACLRPVTVPPPGVPRPKDAHLISTIEGVARTPFLQAVQSVISGAGVTGHHRIPQEGYEG
ncbi:MAG: SDR family oxidoreductase [Kiritimatiellae bacterium]|nr:SDR family oxidoreductase [Kiritimatiellia bacterium]